MNIDGNFSILSKKNAYRLTITSLLLIALSYYVNNSSINANINATSIPYTPPSREITPTESDVECVPSELFSDNNSIDIALNDPKGCTFYLFKNKNNKPAKNITEVAFTGELENGVVIVILNRDSKNSLEYDFKGPDQLKSNTVVKVENGSNTEILFVFSMPDKYNNDPKRAIKAVKDMIASAFSGPNDLETPTPDNHNSAFLIEG